MWLHCYGSLDLTITAVPFTSDELFLMLGPYNFMYRQFFDILKEIEQQSYEYRL